MKELRFNIDAPALLNEIADAALMKNMGVLKIPLNIFRLYLVEVAQRAIELNDPEMNVLMLKMKMYDVNHSDIENLIEIQQGKIRLSND